MANLNRIDIKRRSGAELFKDGKTPLTFDLLSFWQWSASDVVSNATRGILAEYIVAQALGVANNQVRDEWAAYDLELNDGTKIEVKSAAYIQTWQQNMLSKISFRIPKTVALPTEVDKNSHQEPRRQADLYVFALLAECDQDKLNPLDVSQWKFYVVPTFVLDNRERSQHSITLPSLKKLTEVVEYAELKVKIHQIAETVVKDNTKSAT